MQQILLIHPDVALRQELTFVLRHSGFQVAACVDGEGAVAEMYGSSPDLIVMAEESHGLNGNELCIRLRQVCQAPIIVLGQDHDEADGIGLLEMGADAYLTFPLNVRELLARVRSLLRRSGVGQEGPFLGG